MPLDATLSVPGLPQSGTGQTTLLTGVNASALLGRHRGPYPGVELHELLARRSMFADVRAAGGAAALANAYPEPYLERVLGGRARMSAFARAAHSAGVRLRNADDLRDGRAASAFLTNRLWRERFASDVEVVTEREAGRAVARLTDTNDLVCFLYYATDIAGHKRDFEAAIEALESFDSFLAGVTEALSDYDVVVIASDHGNVEDMTTRSHTRNPAVGAWLGHKPARVPTDLTAVAPAILSTLGAGS
jgi:hypothetical protein